MNHVLPSQSQDMEQTKAKSLVSINLDYRRICFLVLFFIRFDFDLFASSSYLSFLNPEQRKTSFVFVKAEQEICVLRHFSIVGSRHFHWRTGKVDETRYRSQEELTPGSVNENTNKWNNSRGMAMC